MKKTIFVTLLVLFVSLAVFANGKTEGSSAAVLGSEPVEITFWHCASDDAATLVNKYVRDFNATNNYQIKVKAVYMGQYSDATTSMKTMIGAEQYDELPDVMQLDSTGKVAYLDSGKAFTVDDAIKQYGVDVKGEYLGAALNNWNYSGVQLGLPFASSTTIAFYNKDLLKKAGWGHCPTTFAEVAQLSKDMQAAGLDAAALGVVPNSPTLTGWLCQMGKYFINNRNGNDALATELVCDDDGSLLAFIEEYNKMVKADIRTTKSYKTADFVGQKVAIYLSSSSEISNIIKSVGGDFEVGVTNQIKVNAEAQEGFTMGGSCIVMFDKSSALKKAAAWEFARYLTGAEVQADFAAGTGYIPACTAATESRIYQNFIAENPLYQIPSDQVAATPAMMCSCTVGPSYGFYYSCMGIATKLAAGETPAQVTAELAADLQNQLDQHLRSN